MAPILLEGNFYAGQTLFGFESWYWSHVLELVASSEGVISIKSQQHQ